VTDLLEHWFSYAADMFDYALGVETVVMMGGIMYGAPADEREAQEHCCQLLSRFLTVYQPVICLSCLDRIRSGNADPDPGAMKVTEL
jgi:hypothetical protein